MGPPHPAPSTTKGTSGHVRAGVRAQGASVPQTGEGTLKTLVSSWVSHLAVMPTASERTSWLTMTQTLAPGTRRQATHRAAGGAHPRTPSALNSGRTVSGRQLPRHPSLPGKENGGARQFLKCFVLEKTATLSFFCKRMDFAVPVSLCGSRC